MKKKIEEMMNLLCKSTDGKCNGDCNDCLCTKQAEAIYNAGYRKQSEGEWLKKLWEAITEPFISVAVLIDESKRINEDGSWNTYWERKNKKRG